MDPSTLPFEDRYDPVVVRPAEGWLNLPASGPRPLEVELLVRPEFNGAQGHQLPSAKLGIGAQHATLILNGAGIRQGVHLEGQVRQVDVAPTLAYLLGIPVPRGAEGGVVYEALAEPDWYLRAIAELEARLADRATAAAV